ncbi:MAG: hypothetical protein ACRDTR_20270 [Rubrobacter sp.]
MCPEGQRGLPRERPPGALEQLPTLEPRSASRALVVEPHPAVRAVLEYLLAREGYAVETFALGEPFVVAPGPALLLVAGDDDGLYVFSSGDAARALGGFVSGRSPGNLSAATGIQAFLPKPFGIADVLRVVRVVDGFEGRRRVFAEHVADATGEDG